MIRTVLLIPVPGDPGKLLAGGPCGAKPPTAYDVPKEGWVDADRLACRTYFPSNDPEDAEEGLVRAAIRGWPEALVLVWAGAVAPEGCDRACRLAARRHGDDAGLMAPAYTVQRAVKIARACEAAGLGTAVIEEVPDAR